MADRDGSSDERDDEPFVVSGQLKLKGGLKLTRKKKKKSKKKSKKHKKEKDDAKRSRDDDDDDDAEAGASNDVDGEDGAKRARTEDGEEDEEQYEDGDDGLTPAQRAFEKVRQEREAKTLEKLVSKSYRERVEEFNDYLGSLSEHHAVANVGNAGMG